MRLRLDAPGPAAAGQISFLSKRDGNTVGNSGIYLMNADGSSLRNLTNGFAPAWRPRSP